MSAELEHKIDAKYRAYLAAVQRGESEIATIKYHEMTGLMAQRTPEEAARALVVAELTADGRCAHPRKENGVCLKCGGAA